MVHIPAPDPDCSALSSVNSSADDQTDDDSNGAQPVAGGPVTSPVVRLLSSTEPASGVDGDGQNGDLTLDFGFYEPVNMGDYVWEDLNGDGLQQASETGVVDVVVSVFDATSSTLVASTITDTNGAYAVLLPPGNYFVQFSPPTNFVFTLSGQGSNALADSNANINDGTTPPTGFLFSGEEELGIDAGVYIPARLGDTVWIDVNRDGDPSNENLLSIGIPGVTVDLFLVTSNAMGLATNFLSTTVTSTSLASQGFYEFTGLPPGVYYVEVNTSTVPAALTSITTTLSYRTVLTSGAFSMVENFGFITGPTAIELASLAAVEVDGGVLVRWVTAWERDNFAFNVYRSSSVNGARERVNAQMIGAANSSAGAAYEFLDTGMEAGRYFYWLEDIDFAQESTVRGPARVRYEGNVLANYISEQAGVVKVLTDDPANVGVKIDGVEVATLELGDSVLFYVGDAEQQVAVIQLADALRMAMMDGAPSSEDAVALSLGQDGTASFITDAGKSYFVLGFESMAVVLDVNDPATPRLIDAAVVVSGEQAGVYFQVEAGTAVHAADTR